MTKNAILVATERSGTNFFLDVYAQIVPNSLAFREIFRSRGDSFVDVKKLTGFGQERTMDLTLNEPLTLWQTMERDAAQMDHTVIAKIFYDHAPNHPDLWRYLRDNNRVVHLIRRNPFNALLSRHVANQVKKWRQEKQDAIVPTPTPFELPRQRVEIYCAWHKEQVEMTRSFFAGADFHEVFYEDIGKNDQSCADAVSRITGVAIPPGGIASNLVKQKRFTNEDILTNYDDLRDLDQYTY